MRDELYTKMTQAAPKAKLYVDDKSGTARLKSKKFTLISTINPIK